MRATATAANATARAMPVAALALFLSCSAGLAARYSVLYDFCSQAGCADGAKPATILPVAGGRAFGTTYPGGASNSGAIFELEQNRGGSVSEAVIYSFCSLENCADGTLPMGSLVRDTGGTLYGVTSEGGGVGSGEVYALKRRSGGWALKVLYSFCSKNNCSDGKFPQAGLTYAGAAGGGAYDGTSPLYGTTSSGGANGRGTVFELRRGRHGWNAKTLYSFCALANCSDGQSPAATLMIDAAGNIFGTTPWGGQGVGNGVVFELSRSGGVWTETVLHTFCGADNCTDGARPEGGVTMDASGTLFGSANTGGISCSDLDFGPCGLIYSLTPEGENSPYSILYTFGQGGRGNDGANPVGATIPDASGNLFGVTEFGGTGRNGVAWELTGSKLKVLHTFCVTAGDGCDPMSVSMDAKGRLFGTTTLGGTGADSNGIAFELRP